MVFYDYPPTGRHLHVPTGFFRHYQKLLRFLHRNGVIGLSGESQGVWAGSALFHYVRARLMWDIDADVDQLIEEYCRDLFGDAADSPYMMVYGPAPESAREVLGGVLGPGGLLRWHGVSPDREPVFHSLLAAFAQRTGRLPALLNTSLNRPGRPPAMTTDDALEVFATTGLDALFVGPYVVEK